ncbi:hypothetical protein [Micromonospora sp. NPDC050695]|uniref:hypothetical protein n=1 Tax=Micromonospora sp. NPDC050695 TaxID=3154938 RepID=UPI0033C561CB
MSRLDEPTDPAFVAHIARQVIASHKQGHRCQRCTDEGCTEPGWADSMLRRLAAAPAAQRAAIADGRPVDPTAGEVEGARS